MEILGFLFFLFVFLPGIVCGSALAVLWFLEILIEVVCTLLIAIIDGMVWIIKLAERGAHRPENTKGI